MDLQDHMTIVAALGGVTLLSAWLPGIACRLKISYPIFVLLLGMLIHWLQVPLPWPDPFWPDAVAMTFAEIVVVTSLMGAGLTIGPDRSYTRWRTAIRLLLMTMPLTMLFVGLAGWWWLGLAGPAAILLAAVLAPTDPVLAEEVQLQPPEQTDHNYAPVRFTLTSEAGVNDGLAFPFTWLAVLAAQAVSLSEVDFVYWAGKYVLMKTVIGVAAGAAIGFAVAWLLERLPELTGIRSRDGLVAIATAFFVYGLTERLNGYGFLAAFVAGLMIRREEDIDGDMKVKLHNFVSEVERLLLVVWLLLFGGGLLNGLVSGLSIRDWIFAFAAVLIIRPLCGMLAQVGCSLEWKKKMTISWLGIRGIGSVFYMTWAGMQADFDEIGRLYKVVSLVIVISICVHGLTAQAAMKWADASGEETEDAVPA